MAEVTVKSKLQFFVFIIPDIMYTRHHVHVRVTLFVFPQIVRGKICPQQHEPVQLQGVMLRAVDHDV